ncbi:MAG: hypothetical protein ACXVCF_23325 [Isosphaeraceae bacterium]
MSISELRVEAGSVTVMPIVVGSDERISPHDVRSIVARILVGLAFAFARQVETAALAPRFKRFPD